MVGRSTTGSPSPWRTPPQLWRRALGPLALGAAAALGACSARGSVPGRDLAALAEALGHAAGGVTVDPADIRWEPSRGAIADLLFGRRVLYLARANRDEARDVWRSRVRVAADGSVLGVVDAYDLTNTPLGDDHALVARGAHAAFATRAYGQEQSVTALDLAGEGAQNRTTGLADRTMAAITNVQRTGSVDGIGRLDVTFESPGRAVALWLEDDGLDVTLYGGDPRQPPTTTTARVDFARADLAVAVAGMHADSPVHLPKRFSHWTVDTLRAVSWIGPAPIAWAEDQALAARDTYRRLTFSAAGGATDVVVAKEPPPPVLDTSEASVEEAHWPPPTIPTMWKQPEPGEGEWKAPDLPWLRKVPGLAADAPSAFYESFVRPDEERPYSKVLLVAMDMRQLDLDMEAGVEDPEPLTGPPGAGRIPRDPAVYRRVAAAFNGAFKTDHGHYGMMVHKRVLLPPVPASATVVVLDDGRVGFGTWGPDKRVGGLLGIPDDSIQSFRQNLDPLIDLGRINPAGRNLWGFTLPGKGAQTERTGLCVTNSGHLVYAWGDDLSGTTLAKAMAMAGCNYAMHLDMNPYHTGFLFASIDDFAGHKYKTALLTSAMSIQPERYVQYSPKDFFYVMVHDPTPPAIPKADPWVAAAGAQPPPRWLPGLWSTSLEAGGSKIEILDLEAAREGFRVRAGAKDATASSPLRELGGEEARRVLFAVGLGVAPERHPMGLATDGRLAMTVRSSANTGVLLVGADGSLTLARSEEAPALGPHDDLVELPLILWDGHRGPIASPGASDRGGIASSSLASERGGSVSAFSAARSGGGPVIRAALGFRPDGRVILARAASTTWAALAEALEVAGCTRALALDRGASANGTLDRAGTASPPRARYDETVLYAIGLPLVPRAFRFEAATLVAEAPKKAR